jgi:hypothetical protein
MSRTYRKSYLNEYHNIEAYLNRRRGYWSWMNIHDEEDDRQYWNEASRDGCFDYGRNASYRKQTNDIIRAKNRRDLNKVFNDPDEFDNTNFATKRDAKFLIWSIW